MSIIKSVTQYIGNGVLYKFMYILCRLIPLIFLYSINKNTNHNFLLTILAEIFMSLDDIDVMSYKTSKICGGAVFLVEKLFSYNSYLDFMSITSVLQMLLFYFFIKKIHPDTDFVILLYLVITFNWFCKIFGMHVFNFMGITSILGSLIYFITDYDVAIYDSNIFGILLLPSYYVGLFLLTF
jgi:hypothetical protein